MSSIDACKIALLILEFAAGKGMGNSATQTYIMNKANSCSGDGAWLFSSAELMRCHRQKDHDRLSHLVTCIYWGRSHRNL